MGSQDGKGLLSILIVVLIVFGMMWLAVPWMQKVGIRPDEASAMAELKRIYAAQQDHYGASRMYGSLSKLTNSKLMSRPQDDFRSGGYVFSHSTNGRGSAWCATAVPEEGKPGRRFGIDESGTVYEGVAATACYGGTLDSSGGSPVR